MKSFQTLTQFILHPLAFKFIPFSRSNTSSDMKNIRNNSLNNNKTALSNNSGCMVLYLNILLFGFVLILIQLFSINLFYCNTFLRDMVHFVLLAKLLYALPLQ